jgi:addiction module RelE/StbE family toxin
MQISFARKFKKQYEKASNKIQTAFDNRLEQFQQDQYFPLLDNHALTGQYSGSRSIDVTGNWRAIFNETIDKEGEKIITFELLGTHPQLYG